MQNIIPNSQNYHRFHNCSAAIQIIVCLLMLIFLIKQIINFYNKNYIPFTMLESTQKKYEQNTGVMLQNIGKNQQNVLQNEQVNQISKENNNNMNKSGMANMVTSKTKVLQKDTVIQKQKVQFKTQVVIKQKVQPISSTTNLQRHTISYKINISIQKIMIKLPIISILVINIMLLTAYQFLVTLGCILIGIFIVGHFIEWKWKIIGLILEICVAGLAIATFINAYATGRINPLRY